ncbi:hypothetical protein HN789_05335 [archaeon]|jgi:predicted transcriptional regulator|nr:hypothetical protein [archaeon]MBT4022935.1 hypothetical protein [archaeon]MBT4271926.1 hypothetical protein [archaeon]MBT4461764.1 hypothetical protein [archaeon]MBT5424537.1 hypothetical protein [archaeon]
MRKRDRLEIIKDILQAISDKRGNIKPTHIMYKANLSHQMLTEYMNEILEKELADETIIKKKKKYEITTKGLSYLKDYNMIRGFVDSYGLE